MVITNLVLNKDVGSLMKRFMVVTFQKIPIIWVILFVVCDMGNPQWWEDIHTTLGQRTLFYSYHSLEQLFMNGIVTTFPLSSSYRMVFV